MDFRPPDRPQTPTALFVAIIGDIVASRRLQPDQRKLVQDVFRELLSSLNGLFARALIADFKLSSGDEFEALIQSSSAAEVIPDLIWHVEEVFSGLAQQFPAPRLALRIGIGLGSVATEITRDPNTIDGPAFHYAREAIQLAAKKKRLGGVFRGFGEQQDAILNGIARLLHHHRTRWSPQQHRLAGLLHQNLRKSEAAIQLDLTKQAVSSYARAAGWEAYAEGEMAWRKTIEACTSSANPLPGPPMYDSPRSQASR